MSLPQSVSLTRVLHTLTPRHTCPALPAATTFSLHTNPATFGVKTCKEGGQLKHTHTHITTTLSYIPHQTYSRIHSLKYSIKSHNPVNPTSTSTIHLTIYPHAHTYTAYIHIPATHPHPHAASPTCSQPPTSTRLN